MGHSAFQTPSGRGTYKESANFHCLVSSPASQGDFILAYLVTRCSSDGFISTCSPMCHLKCDKPKHANFLKESKVSLLFPSEAENRWTG